MRAQLETTMKRQLSRQTKRSRPVSSKIQTKRRPAKVGSRKRIGSTALAKKSNGIRRASPTKARSEKRITPLINKNRGIANNDYALSIDRAAPKEASFDRPDTKDRHLMRHEEAIGPIKSANGASESDRVNRSFTRSWLEWSNATMATNQRTMEELIRCKSPIDFWAVSSRLALRSWFNLWPLSRRPESRPSV
jgi:cell pole-organizing protein PopZ